MISEDCMVCMSSKEELTSRGDSTFLYTSHISRKKFMAEIRNEQVQNHLKDKVFTVNTDKTKPLKTLPCIHIPNITFLLSF